MDEKIEQLLFQTAAFLNMITSGLVPIPSHTKQEAGELLEKIGKILADNS